MRLLFVLFVPCAGSTVLAFYYVYVAKDQFYKNLPVIQTKVSKIRGAGDTKAEIIQF